MDVNKVNKRKKLTKLCFNKLPESGIIPECDKINLQISLNNYACNLLKYSIRVDDIDVSCLQLNKACFEIEVIPNSLKNLVPLGRGAYGIVSKVQHLPSLLMLAIKKIPLSNSNFEYYSNKNNINIFTDASYFEAKKVIANLKTLCKIDCPFIIHYYGYLLNQGELWITMEVMDCSLQEFVKAFKLYSLEIDEQDHSIVVLALRFLRKDLHILHRDIRPSNILLGNYPFLKSSKILSDFTSFSSNVSNKFLHNLNAYTTSNFYSRIKLCDFGVCAQLSNINNHSLSTKNNLTMDIGCQPYLAPERICMATSIPKLDLSNQTSANKKIRRPMYGSKSDIWSLGISLLEVCTGEIPYPTWENPFEQLKSVVEDPSPTLPPKFKDVYSTRLNDFINQCLIKSYEERPSYDDLLKHSFLSDYPFDALINFLANQDGTNRNLQLEDEKLDLTTFCLNSPQMNTTTLLLPPKETPYLDLLSMYIDKLLPLIQNSRLEF